MKKIAVIGDFSISKFFYGEIEKISKDAPIPIINIKNSQQNISNSGLITEMLTKFGMEVLPFGLIGEDNDGNWIKAEFKKKNIVIENLVSSSEITTSVENRIIVDLQQVCRFDQSLIPHNKGIVSEMIKKFKKNINDIGIVIIADYGLGTINQEIIKKIYDESEKNGIKVFVSSTGFRYYKFKDLDVMLKINLKDSYSTIGIDVAQKINSKIICKKISKLLGVKEILLTKGHDGITILDNEEILELVSTQNERLDVKGIGEVMIAAIVVELMKKNSFQDACIMGNIAAGIAVSSRNVYSITKSDIIKGKKEYEEWINQK